jgi:hypothetical protein
LHNWIIGFGLDSIVPVEEWLEGDVVKGSMQVA